MPRKYHPSDTLKIRSAGINKIIKLKIESYFTEGRKLIRIHRKIAALVTLK